MVKVTPKGDKAPAKKTPAKKAPPKNTARKAPAAKAGDETREALADDKQPMTSEQASQPDKAPAGGWGSAADVDGGTVGWGLDGKQQIVDEEGNDASEAGKVAEANKPKGPKIVKNKKPEDDDHGVNLTGMAKDLVNGVERIERLAEERAAIGDDIKEVFAEMKSKGYSVPIIREAIRRRAQDPDKRKEHDDLLSLYEEALRGA